MTSETPTTIGASCEATGHPTECTEPAPGTVENTDNTSILTVNGSDIATRDDRMVFGSHAHEYTPPLGPGCTDFQSHSLQTDQIHPLSIDGTSVMCRDDTTTDPGSGGTASVETTAQTSLTITE